MLLTVAGAGLQLQHGPAEGNTLALQTLAAVQTRRLIGGVLRRRTLTAVSCQAQRLRSLRGAAVQRGLMCDL